MSMPRIAASAFTQAIFGTESQAEIHLLGQTYVDQLSLNYFNYVYKMQWLVLWFEGEDMWGKRDDINSIPLCPY